MSPQEVVEKCNYHEMAVLKTATKFTPQLQAGSGEGAGKRENSVVRI